MVQDPQQLIGGLALPERSVVRLAVEECILERVGRGARHGPAEADLARGERIVGPCGLQAQGSQDLVTEGQRQDHDRGDVQALEGFAYPGEQRVPGHVLDQHGIAGFDGLSNLGVLLQIHLEHVHGGIVVGDHDEGLRAGFLGQQNRAAHGRNDRAQLGHDGAHHLAKLEGRVHGLEDLEQDLELVPPHLVGLVSAAVAVDRVGEKAVVQRQRAEQQDLQRQGPDADVSVANHGQPRVQRADRCCGGGGVGAVMPDGDDQHDEQA